MSSAAQDELNALFARQKVHSTSHPEDAIHSDSSEPTSDIEVSQAQSSDEEEKSGFRKTTTMPSAVYHIPSSTHFDANTGPKGVIADAKSFDRARKRSFRQTIQAFSNNLSGSVFGEKQKAPSPRPRSREGSSSSEFSQEDDEAEFMRTWRANRMTEMQSTTGRDSRTRRLSPSQRRYGYVVTVDPLGYLDAVDRVTAETTVVVLIYDAQSTISGMFEDALVQIARKHEFTRFVKLSYLDAEMDPVSVPAVLAYKAGDLIANLVSIVDEMPVDATINASNLEHVLQRHNILH
ncbi:hypothetical protein MMC34_000322 [Xylographa carneopallida]|nr:hypothetical protein [Xylographa carneopallida]